MRRIIKTLLIVIACVAVFLLGAKFYIQWRFDDIVNDRGLRTYHLDYEDISIDYTLNGITLKEVTLLPKATPDSAGTLVRAKIGTARMDDLALFAFLFSDKLRIGTLSFDQPSFEVYLRRDSSRQKDIRKGMSGLFGDVINSAALKNFSISYGNARIFTTLPDTALFGAAENIAIEADDIRTDSARVDFIIPFKVGRLVTRIDSLEYRTSDYSSLSIQETSFNSVSDDLRMTGIAMKLDTTMREVSLTLPFHKDIIRFTLRSLEVKGINMFDIYGDSFKLYATTIRVDSLQMEDFRNKARPEPNRKEKPMFKSMLDKVKIPLDVDSILISNSSISYSEVPPSGGEAGTVSFDRITGYIEDVTTDSARQKTLESFHARLEALVNGQAALTFDLVVPYSDEHFYLDADIEPFDMTILNQTLVPLASLRIDSGEASAFRLRMDAGFTQSNNTLNLDYRNLNLSVLSKTGQEEKNGLLSTIANAFVKSSNDKGEGSFENLEYVTERRMNRSPFNYMWMSIKDGLREIMPSTAGSIVIPKNNKNEKD